MLTSQAVDAHSGEEAVIVSPLSVSAVNTPDYNYPAAGAARPHAPTSLVGDASLGAGTYGTDAAGNITAMPGKTVTYNEAGNLASVTAGAATQTHIYDASGDLLLRLNSVEGAALFLGDTVLTKKATGTTVYGVRTYSGAKGIPVAERTANSGTSGSVVTWLFSDVTGTVDTRSVAATGTTEQTFRDPFGGPLAGAVAYWSSGNGYLNKPGTASTGLSTIGARTYAASLGKFLSVDPITDPHNPQQNAGYAYGRNNPLGSPDPSGLAPGLMLSDGCGGAACGVKTAKSFAEKAKQGAKPSPKTQTAAPKGGCQAGDWSCRVDAATAKSDCGGAGKFRACKSQPGPGIWSYGYSYDHFVTNRKGMTPTRVMDIFKRNAQTVFPFDVQGCAAFTNGAECDLRTGTPLLNPNGVVGVTTTDTSVKFTVIERGYFDAPGSTIEFSVAQREDGIYLTQTADAFGADAFTALGLGVMRAALPTWEQQARNLTALVEAER